MLLQFGHATGVTGVSGGELPSPVLKLFKTSFAWSKHSSGTWTFTPPIACERWGRIPMVLESKTIASMPSDWSLVASSCASVILKKVARVMWFCISNSIDDVL